MKKNIYTIYCFLLLSFSANAQKQDCISYYFNQFNQFFIYENGITTFAEPVKPKSVKAGRHSLAYINNVDRLRLYYGGKIYTVIENNCDYYMTDNWFVYKNYGQIGVLYNNKIQVLDRLAQDTMFLVSDSLIVWTNTTNTQQVFYNGTVQQLEQWPVSAAKIGDNILAYVDEIGNFKAFYKGERKTLEGYTPNNFLVNRDLIVYEDYYNSYKFYYKGNIYESAIPAQKNNYWLGECFFAYINLQGQLKVWYEGEEMTICQDRPKEFTIKENMIVFTDKGNNFWCWYKGKLTMLEKFQPSDYEVDNDFLVYKDLYGFLKGFYFGKKVNVSDQIPNSYMLNNYTVAYTVAEGETRFWCNGSIESVR